MIFSARLKEFSLPEGDEGYDEGFQA